MRVVCIPLTISRILATTLLMFLLIGILQGVYSYDEMKRRDIKNTESIKQIRELQWQLVESSITDNYNNAELLSIGIKTNIETQVLEKYPNRAKLRHDLENPNINAAIYNIFTDSIKGKYLNNIVNDNNDPFIASRQGVISDLSLNCSPDGTMQIRSWDQEIAIHSNTILAAKAIQSMTMQSNKTTFWEFKSSDNPNHIMIAEMDIKELHRVFIEEGLEGLQTYEFLKPVYVQQNADILGISDVNTLGVKQQNSKIIIVSGFNIYDIILKYHKSAMDKYEVAIDILNRDNIEANNHSKVINSFICITLLFCIVITAIINNFAVSMIQKNNTCINATGKGCSEDTD